MTLGAGVLGQRNSVSSGVCLRTWLQAADSALVSVAAQGARVTVRRWSETIATASCWVSPEPAENA